MLTSRFGAALGHDVGGDGYGVNLEQTHSNTASSQPSLSDPIRLVQRSQLCLAAGLAPVWKMRENHAKILTSLGCVPVS